MVARHLFPKDGSKGFLGYLTTLYWLGQPQGKKRSSFLGV